MKQSILFMIHQGKIVLDTIGEYSEGEYILFLLKFLCILFHV